VRGRMSSGGAFFFLWCNIIMSLHNVSSIPRWPMSLEHPTSRLHQSAHQQTQDVERQTQCTHRKALSTNFCSNLATSALNCSTCSQQSKGLRSFNLKHCTNPSLAFSKLASVLFSTPLRRSSLLRNSATSLDTVSLLRDLDCEDEGVRAEVSLSLSEESSEEGSSSDEGVRRSVYWARRAASSLRMRSSSAVTRCWIWSSRLRWRVESVFVFLLVRTLLDLWVLVWLSQYLGAVL
jgi:hypothetical protein